MTHVTWEDKVTEVRRISIFYKIPSEMEVAPHYMLLTLLTLLTLFTWFTMLTLLTLLT